MGEAILVNLHTHTIFSDGEQTPEALARRLLEAAGVRYAALTDHDTIEGLARFQEALRKRGMHASLTGVELTTRFGGREAHLLGYGFDPEHPSWPPPCCHCVRRAASRCTASPRNRSPGRQQPSGRRRPARGQRRPGRAARDRRGHRPPPSRGRARLPGSSASFRVRPGQARRAGRRLEDEGPGRD